MDNEELLEELRQLYTPVVDPIADDPEAGGPLDLPPWFARVQERNILRTQRTRDLLGIDYPIQAVEHVLAELRQMQAVEVRTVSQLSTEEANLMLADYERARRRPIIELPDRPKPLPWWRHVTRYDVGLLCIGALVGVGVTLDIVQFFSR